MRLPLPFPIQPFQPLRMLTIPLYMAASCQWIHRSQKPLDPLPLSVRFLLSPLSCHLNAPLSVKVWTTNEHSFKSCHLPRTFLRANESIKWVPNPLEVNTEFSVCDHCGSSFEYPARARRRRSKQVHGQPCLARREPTLAARRFARIRPAQIKIRRLSNNRLLRATIFWNWLLV